MTLVEEIKRIIKGDVSEGLEERMLAATDASIFEVEPELVVAPHSVEDIKNLVSFISARKSQYPSLSLTARAAGTDMTGGPLTQSIVVDFKRYLSGVKNLDVEKREVRVLPGTFYRDMASMLAEHKLLLPSYPASKNLCTVGGMVANNSGGEKTLTYGKTNRYVAELKAVFSNGEEYTLHPMSGSALETFFSRNDFQARVYRKLFELIKNNQELLVRSKPRVSKNSAGYALWDVWDGKTFDPTQLIVGSQGTLALITEITFKLVIPKEHSALLVIFLHDFQKLAEVVKTILAHKPESFESYDDHTMKLAVRFMPDMLKTLGAKNLISLGLKFWPEIKMIMLGGVPKLILVAEFTGDSEEEIYKKAQGAETDLLAHELQTHVYKKDVHIARNDAEEDKYWTIRRESFNLLRKHVRGKHTAPFIDDVVVEPACLVEFLPELSAITNAYDLTYTIAGHVGDGNFHIIPLMDFNRPDFKKIISELSQKVYDLVAKYGGSITGEHNNGIIRTPYLEKMYGKEVTELFRQTKEIFDPQNIFNPGKKVKGSWAYALSHIRHW